ncbi:MAG: helix-turn-helix transcriptional regulator [Myxococcota bacterium]
MTSQALDITTHDFEGKPIRSVLLKGLCRFPAADIAAVLELDLGDSPGHLVGARYKAGPFLTDEGLRAALTNGDAALCARLRKVLDGIIRDAERANICGRVSKALRSERKELGLSQSAMAKKIGLRQSSYSAIEGGRELSLSRFVRVMNRTGLSADVVLGLQGDEQAA